MILVLIVTLLPARAVSAAEGDVDSTFLGENITGADDSVGAFSVQSDGKILTGGTFWYMHNRFRGRIARLNADGTLDTAYRASGLGADYAVYTIQALADGKALVGGLFTSIDGTGRDHIARLNANGTLDTTFTVTIPGETESAVVSIVTLADGDILIAGGFSQVNGVARGNIARLNADGTLDTAFMDGLTGTNGQVQRMVVQADGKILIGGFFTTVNGVDRGRIARLNTDGSLDTTFMSAPAHTGANNIVSGLAVQSNGQVLVAGYFTHFHGTSRRYIARLNTDGSLDTGYPAAPSSGPDETVRTVHIQTDGKAVICGYFRNVDGASRNYIARLNTNGTLDTTYMNALSGANDSISTAELLSSGKMLVGGRFTQINGGARGRLARLNGNGSLDSTYMTAGASSEVNAIALQPDGKLWVGGRFGAVNAQTRESLARLNPDGSLDTQAFSNNLSGPNGPVNAIVLQPDGKILIGGSFTSVNGVDCKRIARLYDNGILDISFKAGGVYGTDGEVYALALQPDGRVLVGGHFENAANGARQNLARLNQDGTLDATFADPQISKPASYTVVYSLALQPDGKIIALGDFTQVGGVTRNYVARLNADGSLDSGYLNNAQGPNSLARWVDLDPAGNAIIGGWFTQVNGQSFNRVARLSKADGSPDAAFLTNGSSGPNNGVRGLAVQTDGKILIGGEFTQVDEISRGHVARLNADGSLDETFLAGGAGSNNGWVNVLTIQPDSHVLIGGDFTTVNGLERGRVARLLAESKVKVFLPVLMR